MTILLRRNPNRTHNEFVIYYRDQHGTVDLQACEFLSAQNTKLFQQQLPPSRWIREAQ